MNFVSHLYFDREQSNPCLILGVLLPDLLKNTDKSWNAHPQKKPALFEDNIALKSIHRGWNRHLKVDLHFHSSAFFKEETSKIKNLLVPILTNSPVRPSFLAHISLELLLDHLLIINHKIDLKYCYEKLVQVKNEDISKFLRLCNIEETDRFLKFLENFCTSRYLMSYDKTENIAYALKRICMRLWDNPIDEDTNHKIKNILDFHKKHLENNFMIIFEEIERHLT